LEKNKINNEEDDKVFHENKYFNLIFEYQYENNNIQLFLYSLININHIKNMISEIEYNDVENINHINPYTLEMFIVPLILTNFHMDFKFIMQTISKKSYG